MRKINEFNAIDREIIRNFNLLQRFGVQYKHEKIEDQMSEVIAITNNFKENERGFK